MASETSGIELLPFPVDVSAYRARLPEASDAAQCTAAAARALAQAVAAGSAAGRIEDGIVVVRESPEPRVGILTRVPDVDRDWLGAALGSMEGILGRLRVIQWPEVEAAAESLARKLRGRVPEDVLDGADLYGIPRGGKIVAGLVAYALDLPAAALEASSNSDGPVLVVDDCSLSGARFHEYLSAIGRREVIFAPLFSTKALRTAIEESEERVLACVSGADLTDHAPRRLGEDYGKWVRAWRRRSGNAVYWIGQPDHLIFPWAEPDESVWDDHRGRERAAFSLAPPELCLSQRTRLRGSLRVCVLPRDRRPLAAAPELLWGSVDGVTLIRDCEKGRQLTLEGTAAAIWDALVGEGSIECASYRVAEAYGAPVKRIREDVREFARGLQKRGALVEYRNADESWNPDPVPSGTNSGEH